MPLINPPAPPETDLPLRGIDHDPEYQQILIASGAYLDSPLGIVSDDPLKASDKRFVRQNNFIITYMQQLSKKLDVIFDHVKMNTDTLVAQQTILKTTTELLLRQHEVVENMLGLQGQQYQNSINELTTQLKQVVQQSMEQQGTSSSSQPPTTTTVATKQSRSTKFLWK